MNVYDFSGHLSPLPPGVKLPLQLSGKVCLAGDVRAQSVEIGGALIRLAASMVRGSGMPSEHYEDHGWCKTTPQAERRRVLEQAERANEQARQWGTELKKLADMLSMTRS
jgi:hypothetical protein